MIVSLIVAMTRKGVMGVDNRLPWRIPGDLKRFRRLTRGHAVVMGRKTWDSLGRALPDRLNVVITRNPGLALPPGVLRAASLDEALALCPREDEVFVIGGAEIFRQALPRADRAYVTWVEADIAGDTVFPETDLEGFRSVAVERETDPLPHVFEDYARTGPGHP